MSRLAVVRLFAAVLLLLAATSTIFAVEPSQPATASPVTDSATSWSAGTLIDPARGDVSAVSCPTPSFSPLWTGMAMSSRTTAARGLRPIVSTKAWRAYEPLSPSRAQHRASAPLWTGMAMSSRTTAARGRPTGSTLATTCSPSPALRRASAPGWMTEATSSSIPTARGRRPTASTPTAASNPSPALGRASVPRWTVVAMSSPMTETRGRRPTASTQRPSTQLA